MKQTKTRVTPFLMFDGQAEAAMKCYVALFPGATIEAIEKYGPGEEGGEGTIKQATFAIAGQRVMCIDSPVKHEFTFTPSFSLFVDCENEEQIANLFAELSQGGEVMMPLGNFCHPLTAFDAVMLPIPTA